MNGQSWDKNYIRHNTQNDDKQSKKITKKTQKMNPPKRTIHFSKFTPKQIEEKVDKYSRRRLTFYWLYQTFKNKSKITLVSLLKIKHADVM